MAPDLQTIASITYPGAGQRSLVLRKLLPGSSEELDDLPEEQDDILQEQSVMRRIPLPGEVNPRDAATWRWEPFGSTLCIPCGSEPMHHSVHGGKGASGMLLVDTLSGNVQLVDLLLPYFSGQRAECEVLGWSTQGTLLVMQADEQSGNFFMLFDRDGHGRLRISATFEATQAASAAMRRNECWAPSGKRLAWPGKSGFLGV